MAHPGDWTFAVRTHDTVTGFEEANTDARVHFILDASGVDVTNRPSAPNGLFASAITAGGIRVEWSYLYVPGTVLPTSFKVWIKAGASVDYTLSPTQTVPYFPGHVHFSVDVPGYTNGTTYAVAVRATNASGDETNVNLVTVIADSAGPLPVVALTAVASY